MYKIFILTDSILLKAEDRFGKIPISVLIGLIFLLLTMLVSATRFETLHHGNGFTRLSLHPFDMDIVNDLRYRILSPLLGYILFFRGLAFKYFMLIILALFFGFLYFFQRKNNLTPTESLGITALCAFSTLAFYQLYFPAYTDPLSFLLILFLLIYFRNKYLSTILLSLLLFNHENTMFLFPFFFLLMLDGNYNLKKIIGVGIKFLIAIIPYLIYRKFISSFGPPEYTLTYYLDPHNMQWTREHVLPNLSEGIFQAFRLAWLVPLAALAIDIYEKRYREILLMGVILIFVLLQLLVAYDISRLVGMSFPVIIISAMRMQKFLGTKKFLYFTFSIVLLNFFVPSYCIGALEPISYAPAWMK